MMILPTFLTIESADITTMIGYMSDLFSDLSPIILLIVGVGLGLMVISVILRTLRGD